MIPYIMNPSRSFNRPKTVFFSIGVADYDYKNCNSDPEFSVIKIQNRHIKAQSGSVILNYNPDPDTHTPDIRFICTVIFLKNE